MYYFGHFFAKLEWICKLHLNSIFHRMIDENRVVVGLYNSYWVPPLWAKSGVFWTIFDVFLAKLNRFVVGEVLCDMEPHLES